MITTDRIAVLDHGHVDFISVMGDDLTVVNAARVSFNKESEWDIERTWNFNVTSKELQEKDKKLIAYLAKHKHWTPFAHPQITLRIKAPIFIRTQLFKHKVGFVENEVSRRYVVDAPEFYIPKWRRKPTDGAKQGSSDFIQDALVEEQLEKEYNTVIQGAIRTYENLLEQGVAPEQARSVLPQGTYTEWWWTGSLAAYARVYHQRSDPHAQWEVREYANAIGHIISPLFPVSWHALTTK
jgi:thymidylate synthase (FAD)